jgi:hypothetical protein
MLLTVLLLACPHAGPPTPQALPGFEVTTEQGGVQVSVWPPAGDRCAEAVRCCEAMWAVDPGMELACKLAAALHVQEARTSCDELATNTTTIWAEMGHPALPAACPR